MSPAELVGRIDAFSTGLLENEWLNWHLIPFLQERSASVRVPRSRPYHSDAICQDIVGGANCATANFG